MVVDLYVQPLRVFDGYIILLQLPRVDCYRQNTSQKNINTMATDTLLNKQSYFESLLILSESNSTITTTNTTHASIAALFPQFDENVGSIVVSCVFLTSYAIVLSAIAVLLIRYRQEMKKNQVIVFLLVSWCMIQQSIALAFRLGYNGKALSLNLNYSDYTTIENLSSHFLPIYICSAIENMAVYLQGVVIVVITCFILNML